MIRNHVQSDHRFLTREFHSRTSCCNKTLLFTYSHGLKLNTVVPTRMLRAFNVIDILINITIQIFSWKFSWNLPISTMSMIKLLVSSEESLNESITRYHDRKAVNASRSVSQKTISSSTVILHIGNPTTGQPASFLALCKAKAQNSYWSVSFSLWVSLCNHSTNPSTLTLYCQLIPSTNHSCIKKIAPLITKHEAPTQKWVWWVLMSLMCSCSSTACPLTGLEGQLFGMRIVVEEEEELVEVVALRPTPQAYSLTPVVEQSEVATSRTWNRKGNINIRITFNLMHNNHQLLKNLALYVHKYYYNFFIILLHQKISAIWWA